MVFVESGKVTTLNLNLWANLLKNSSFEERSGDNFNDWGESATSPSTITADTSDSYDGGTSVKYTIVGSNYASINQPVSNIFGSTNYTLSFYAKTNVVGRNIYIAIKDNEGYSYCATGWNTSCSGIGWPKHSLTTDWKSYPLSFTTRASVTSLKMVAIRRSGKDYEFNIDDVRKILDEQIIDHKA